MRIDPSLPGRALHRLRRLVTANRLAQRHARDDAAVTASDVPLTIFMPVISKDLAMLPLAIESLRTHVKHPLKKMLLATRAKDSAVFEFGRSNGCEVIDERELLGPALSDLRYLVNGKDRSGWIKQQFLKLKADAACETERYLVLDSDTAFARPVTMLRDGRDVLVCSLEYHRPYRRTMDKLFAVNRHYPLSFVSHLMLFNRGILAALRSEIERRAGKPWEQAIVEALDPTENSSFSEYETYGNFAVDRFGDRVTTRYWRNTTFDPKMVRSLADASSQYGGRVTTISSHVYPD
jgi:hypothetical protein